MENAADALKIAFGLIVFATAITLLFIMTSNTRSTADQVFTYADDTYYYSHINPKETNREVTVSDVITTLYRYYNESVAVTVKLDGSTYVFDVNNETYKCSKYEGKQLTSVEQIEENLGVFVNEILMPKTGTKFRERFLEVPTSGIYLVDGTGESEITLAAGNRKIYITYEEI